VPADITGDGPGWPRGSRYAAPVSWRYLADDGERDPGRNLAREEALARVVAADRAATTPVLRLWRNDRCAVVGRFQVAAAEVDMAVAAALGIPVLRRFTGGGTVYHDPGNLNVSLVLRPDDPLLLADPATRRLPGLYRVLLEPLAAAARGLGVPARATERDLVVERPDGTGAKIGGVAAWLGSRALLVHGTLLVDADLAALDRVCAGPGAQGDPRWERTRSRRATVTSLVGELAAHGVAPPTAADVERAILAGFGTGPVVPSTWSAAELAAADRLLDDRYADPHWHAAG
jgi:lipoate-protein ligase A